MENITKIKVPFTKVTVALIYDDGTSEITDFVLVGSYSIRSAEKFLLSKDCRIDLANVKTLKVIEVVKGVEIFTVNINDLYEYLLGKVVTNTEC